MHCLNNNTHIMSKSVFRLPLLSGLSLAGLHTGRAQCPEITVTQKYDHELSPTCIANGWDTVVDCTNGSLVLSCSSFITTQHFNGQYTVEQIPYNPVDPTFHAGSRLNISSDDQWESTMISFPFTFLFFGIPYTQANVGSNGLVSFNSAQAGTYCDYTFSVPIPRSDFSTSRNTSKNAIYGVYEDIDPQGLSATQGMFRYVGGEYPCRHLCASVNEVPLFPYGSNQNNRCTYQIVCYEGTNIIEVHVKKRSCCSSTNSGKGIIGIQNATGQTQVSHYHDVSHYGEPTYYILPNSPGAFVAPNRGNQDGGWRDTVSYEAWRFTPQGETASNTSWWRFIEDENGNIIDSVEFTTNPNDTNGVYLNPDHSSVRVTPTRTTRYLVKCAYQGANGYWYGLDGRSMRDTIVVGMDTAKTMSLVTDDSILCEGERTTVHLQYPQEQQLDSCGWGAMKEINGVRTIMPDNAITVTGTSTVLNDQTGLMTRNRVDSTWIYCTATFHNGCNNYDSILITTYPNYDYYDTAGICRGDSYTWNGMTFRNPVDTSKHFYSTTECDSTRHLHLVVSDLSYNTDFVTDCKPHTWLNGKTYSQDNDETREADTVVLQNEWGCDSIVTLDFTFVPMKAIIGHTPEVATIDELTIDLTDLSYGHDSRMWLLPGGRTSTDAQTSVIFPLSGVDSIDVRLAVHNDYGCDDTAKSVIPLHRISEFVPNVFTPGKEENNRFMPYIQGNVTDIYFWIYNRRGQQVAYFECPGGYWDGNDLQGRPCEQGTYVYIMRYRNSLEPMMTQELKGTVTLIR